MADFYTKLNGKIDRRSPQGEGKPEDPIDRENWLSRDGVLKKPQGTELILASAISGRFTWMARYYTIETGAVQPKTFGYTQDGKLWYINEQAGTATEIKSGLGLNAYPKSWTYKIGTQTKLYLVDGTNLYKYDGNNDNKFDKITILDADGDTINPIDVIEHKDRLCLLSTTTIFVSKNLDPETFSDATDSIDIVVGSGKGKNYRFGKIEDRLYIFNTEGIFVLSGDVISALAISFEVRLIEEKRIIAGGSLYKVERAILYINDDYNLWSFDGNSSQKLSHSEKLEDYVNTYRVQLDKMVATYYNNYYMLSFVEKGQYFNNLEVWWDAFENKIDFVRGRNVSCYMSTDTNQEQKFLLLGHSDINNVSWADRGYKFGEKEISSRVRTRDITVKKGQNVRFPAFYPEFQPIGNYTVEIQYFLDGRSSNFSSTPDALGQYPSEFIGVNQSIQGEIIRFGDLNIGNQNQTIDRVRPRINYSKGTSIAFLIKDDTKDKRVDLLGIGIDYILKDKKKGKTIGA